LQSSKWKFELTGVILYFEPHSRLTPGSIFIHFIINLNLRVKIKLLNLLLYSSKWKLKNYLFRTKFYWSWVGGSMLIMRTVIDLNKFVQRVKASLQKTLDVVISRFNVYLFCPPMVCLWWRYIVTVSVCPWEFVNATLLIS
jgi:hypothetical protein